MKAFLMKTRCEMYSLAEKIKSLNARIDFLEGYLNKQFKTFEKQVNEIISFCNGLTIVGYEDEDGNIVDYPKEESDDEIDEDSTDNFYGQTFGDIIRRYNDKNRDSRQRNDRDRACCAGL